MKTNWARDIRVNYQLLRERFETRLCLLKGLGEKIRWSATSRPSLVHKHQSIRVVSATAIWPTSDLGPRIDRPPFVIPLRDILSFLAECRVISRGKRRAQEFHGYSSPILLLPVLGRFEENHLHHTVSSKRGTRDWFSGIPKQFLSSFRRNRFILQFQTNNPKIPLSDSDPYLSANIFSRSFSFYLSKKWQNSWFKYTFFFCNVIWEDDNNFSRDGTRVIRTMQILQFLPGCVIL